MSLKHLEKHTDGCQSFSSGSGFEKKRDFRQNRCQPKTIGSVEKIKLCSKLQSDVFLTLFRNFQATPVWFSYFWSILLRKLNFWTFLLFGAASLTTQKCSFHKKVKKGFKPPSPPRATDPAIPSGTDRGFCLNLLLLVRWFQKRGKRRMLRKYEEDS